MLSEDWNPKCRFKFIFLVGLMEQGLAIYPRLALTSPCSTGWIQTHNPALAILECWDCQFRITLVVACWRDFLNVHLFPTWWRIHWAWEGEEEKEGRKKRKREGEDEGGKGERKEKRLRIFSPFCKKLWRTWGRRKSANFFLGMEGWTTIWGLLVKHRPSKINQQGDVGSRISLINSIPPPNKARKAFRNKVNVTVETKCSCLTECHRRQHQHCPLLVSLRAADGRADMGHQLLHWTPSAIVGINKKVEMWSTKSSAKSLLYCLDKWSN